jgi:hypothetical protein
MSNVVSIKGYGNVSADCGMTKSRMDTVILTAAKVAKLKLPPFQRPLKINEKVKAIAENMKYNGAVIDGVLTIGEFKGEEWIVDGQHRIEAFKISELPEAYCDVRIIKFDNLAEMAEEFVRLNSFIVRMRTDDILRGLEPENKWLQYIRRTCPFIGYDHIRRYPNSPLLSMTMAVRTWAGASREISSAGGIASATSLVHDMTEEQATEMCEFFNIAFEAWSSDTENTRLWGGLNLTLCAWLWNNMVKVKPGRGGGKRATRLTPEQFKRGLMGLAASGDHAEWLVGRNNSERNRAPCYRRIRSLMLKRLQPEFKAAVYFPAPAWAQGRDP